MHLARCDGAARVRSPRLLQSALQCLCGLGGNRSGLGGFKQVALRRMMDLSVCGNFPRPSLGNPCVRVVVVTDTWGAAGGTHGV